MKSYGLKESVKLGHITPDEAIKWLKHQEYISSETIIPWLKRRKKQQ